MSWRYGVWSADHDLPVGVRSQAQVGDEVIAGDVIASGTIHGTAVTVPGARQLGMSAERFAVAQRIRTGEPVARGTILARGDGRFARTVRSPLEGRLLQVTVAGDLIVAPIIGRWSVRSTLDGSVSRSDPAVVSVTGSAWRLDALAAYGPDAVGELVVAVDAPPDELSPARIDVRLRDRILIGGSRVAAEAITRAHACGAAALVAGAVPAAGLRVVYGDDVSASGLSTRDDRPTVLCLLGFGSAALPPELFRPLVALSGARAAIHAASARLFVFAAADAIVPEPLPALALAADHSGVRWLPAGAELAGLVTFAGGVVAEALMTEAGPLPVANVKPIDTAR